MSQTAIRLRSKVLPGKRVEFTAPELTEDSDVELIVVLPERPVSSAAEPRRHQDVLAFLDSLPSRRRTPEESEEIERELRSEKDAWDR